MTTASFSLGELLIATDIAAAFKEVLLDAYRARSDAFLFALSGGSSAQLCYPQLKELDIDWNQVELFWADERMVPDEDPRSNYGTARALFINSLNPSPHVFPMTGEDGPDAYEFQLRMRPPFDLVHLGLGPDGHTASLFPDSNALNPTDRLVVMNEDPSGRNPLLRMTLTFAGIARSKLVVVTAAGKQKAPILEQLQRGAQLPASHISAPRVIWIIDEDAAEGLG